MREAFTSTPSTLRGDRVEPARWLGWPTYRDVRDAFDERLSRWRWRLRPGGADGLTPEQRRGLAEAALRIVPELPDRRLAAMVGLSHQTIGRLRAERLDHSAGRVSGSTTPFAANASGGVRDTSGAMATMVLEREIPGAPEAVAAAAPELRGRRNVRRGCRDGSTPAVYAATPDDPVPHFIGWLDEVDVEELFERGEIFGVTVRRIRRAAWA